MDEVLEQRRQEQEAQKANHINSAQNMGGNRGDVDIEGNQFLELYEAEQEIKRTFAPLEPIRAEDFVIDDNTSYAITVLK